MATRGSALTVSIATDLSGFDTDAAAKGLDEVGQAGDDAAKELAKATQELERLAKQGRDAEKELDKIAKADAFDKLGTDAKAAANKVDDAMDRIGKSGRDNLRKVDDEADKARKGIDEMGDEAQSTAKEAAASFTDVESALDAVQEIAANAFAGFGPAGVAAGAAAAVGIGLLFSGLQTAADKANEAKDRIIEMASAIREVGGNMAEVDLVGLMREWSDAIVDNKSFWEIWQKENVTNFEVITDLAKKAGLSFDDMFDAMRGDDPEALARTLDEITRGLEENARAREEAGRLAKEDVTASRRSIDALGQEEDALLGARKAIEDKAGVTEAAIQRAAEFAAVEEAAAEKTAGYAAIMEDAASATAEFNDATKNAAEGVATSTDDMADAIEKVARKKAKLSAPEDDTWQDWKDKVVGSIDDVIAAQEKDIQASIDFQTNQEEVFAAVGEAGVQWALAQGENAAKAMELLANAPKEKQEEIVGNYTTLGNLATEGVGDGMVNGIPVVESAANAVHAAAKARLDREINIPTGVDSNPSAAFEAYRAAERILTSNPITIPTRLGTPAGLGPGFGGRVVR